MKKNKIKILNIVGARPNFMKIAPLFKEYRKNKTIVPVLVHTNQHSDEKMSGVFLKSLNIPRPNYNLNINKKSPISTISSIMSGLEPILKRERPDLVVVVGDVNSTLAGALAANKSGIKVAHVEAGLRSEDLNMPEEINRILVDHISEILFVTEKSGLKNLQKENVTKSKIFFVGNTMIDNLINTLPKIDRSKILNKIGIEGDKYIVLTMHRPSNVDSRKKLLTLIEMKKRIIKDTSMKIIFPIHPRTLNNVKIHGLLGELKKIKDLIVVDPLDYLDFIKLIKKSSLILTDSGGIQEEAAYLKIPTITLRESTERPSTVECGANVLHQIGNVDDLIEKIKIALTVKRNSIKDIPLNDGKAAQKIVKTILNAF